MPSPRFPDLLCIGVQRSGTTWLWRNLVRFPSVYAPPYKELTYLNQRTSIPSPAVQEQRRSVLQDVLKATREGRLQDPKLVQWFSRFALARRNDDAWYTSLFTEASADALAIDFSPAYARMDAGLVARVAQRMPDVRLILMLRDPIDRAWSQLQLLRSLGKAPAVNSPAEFQRWCQSPDVAANSHYKVILDRWAAVFGAERIFIGFYEEVQQSPLQLLERLMAWLELPYDASVVETSTSTVYNRKAKRVIPEPFARAAAPVMLPSLVPLAATLGGPSKAWLDRCTQLLGVTG